MAKKILIIEDDQDISLFLKNILASDGYRAIAARNGSDGMAQVNRSKPDLVIIDAMLPEESGIHLYRQLRSDRSFRKLPIIMMATLDKRTLCKAHRLKPFSSSKPWCTELDAYLAKPPEAEELLGLVRGLFDSTDNGPGEKA